jgi:uncharacterized membrane-anchored protein
MGREVNKFDDLSQLYERFTKQNKENLMKTAKHLLKVQKEDAAMLANADALATPVEREKRA